jgi:hypothetical protein
LLFIGFPSMRAWPRRRLGIAICLDRILLPTFWPRRG